MRECTLTQTYTERLIPHAVKWFTGEAEDEDDDYDEDDEDMEGFEDDEEVCH